MPSFIQQMFLCLVWLCAMSCARYWGTAWNEADRSQPTWSHHLVRGQKSSKLSERAKHSDGVLGGGGDSYCTWGGQEGPLWGRDTSNKTEPLSEDLRAFRAEETACAMSLREGRSCGVRGIEKRPEGLDHGEQGEGSEYRMKSDVNESLARHIL